MRNPALHPARALRALLAAAAVALPAPLAAQGIVAPPRCLDDRPCPRPLPMPLRQFVERTASTVDARLDGRIVRYEVRETFVNRGGGLGEADYLFPLPRDAAFEALQLEINGELVAGEVLNAAEARRIYEDIVRRQRDPALVEWMGRGLVRARIFPIAPGEEKRVVLRFAAVAAREGDALRVDWFAPAGTTSRLAFRWPDAPGYGDPFSPTHDLALDRDGALRRATVAQATGDLTILLPLRTSDAAAVSALVHAPSDDARHALITFTPPVRAVRRQPRDVTLVLDVSGSMAGEKLEQAKAAGRQVLASLGAGDRVRLVAFSTDVRRFADGFRPATAATVREATRWLDTLRADGSTNIGAALAAALEGAPAEGAVPLVLFVTDGAPTVGIRSPQALADSARAWRGGSRVFTFGVGADVNAALMERLALEGRGTAQFVRPTESVERTVALVAARLAAPLVTDLRVRAEGVRLMKQHPQLPLDVFAGQDVVLLAQVEGHGDATLVFEGTTADGPQRWTERVLIPARETANAFVSRLWATQRVGWLSAERRQHGANAELDAELKALGERYGIPTELTSYLVLEPGITMDAGRPTPSPRGRWDAGGAPTAPPPPPMAAKAQEFEAARAASAQRQARTTAAADAIANEALGSAAGTATRRAAGRALVLRDSTWTDAVLSADARRTVRVQPYSPAWFALANAVPALRELLAVDERVRVAGRAVIVETAGDGASTLSDAEVRRIVREWGT